MRAALAGFDGQRERRGFLPVVVLFKRVHFLQGVQVSSVDYSRGSSGLLVLEQEGGILVKLLEFVYLVQVVVEVVILFILYFELVQ